MTGGGHTIGFFFILQVYFSVLFQICMYYVFEKTFKNCNDSHCTVTLFLMHFILVLWE